MIFKNNGDIIRKNTDGDHYFTNDKIYRKAGNNLFGSDGSRAIHNDSITFKNQKSIRVSGNSLFTSDGERYILNGTILFGPHGEQWRGVSSMDEARNIVSMNM